MVSVKVTRKQNHNAKKGITSGSLNGLREIVIAVESQSKVLAPVDKGFLRASIRNRIQKLKGYIFSNIDYALYQEEGTKRMKAANNGKGYMKPAVEIIRRKLIPIMGKNIRSGIRRS